VCCLWEGARRVCIGSALWERWTRVCRWSHEPTGGPFFFMYYTIFKRVKLRLPLTGFERTLLTEVNVAPAQLHPNSWAFVRAFNILCNHLSHTPSVDVFLYFFEAKNPDKRLWLSFNGVAGRVLLTLFQQSYKVIWTKNTWRWPRMLYLKGHLNRQIKTSLIGKMEKAQSIWSSSY